MNEATKNVITRILMEQCGGISQADLHALVADPETRNVRVLLRFYTHRVVVPAYTVESAIEAGINEFRDASFPCDTHDRLMAELGLKAPDYTFTLVLPEA